MGIETREPISGLGRRTVISTSGLWRYVGITAKSYSYSHT